jgi:hypothetical protein
MGFEDLPNDLKNIVSDFAYKCKWETVENDLKMCKTIEKMDLSIVFVRNVMWSSKYQKYMPSPLIKFEPIRNFTNSWGDYIEWHAVKELIWRLDFRRMYVRWLYTREQWRTKLKENWKEIEVFDGFYKFLLYTRVPCFKPIWKNSGFNSLKTHRSPHVSARWWLDFGMY